MSGFLGRLFWWLPFGDVPEISAVDLQEQLSGGKEPLQLLDVRSPSEWQNGVIDGSVLVSVQGLKSRIDDLGFDPSRPVIAICHSATRSVGAVRLLNMAGYEDAKQLQGGMLVWLSNGFSVVKPN
ncbi:hypothetical protein MNBD_ALPHA08-2054 [hydrothermal vent metagenome]|uniref:Rhodanese domain-containing protein n=1 Tax=hydrothermal vent metagenome TaxID=652676 RepID=A0A3B0S2M0_9ZZZZ